MEEATRKTFIELEERVAELERQNERLMNREPGWSEERVEEIPLEIFGLFVTYLSWLDIGFSVDKFREFVTSLNEESHDNLAGDFPEIEKHIGWERMITRHIITKMIPSFGKGDQSEAPAAAD